MLTKDKQAEQTTKWYEIKYPASAYTFPQDLCYFQALRGHASPKMTEIHTKVTNRDLSKIQSPLDALMDEMRKREEGQRNVASDGNGMTEGRRAD